MHTMKKSIEIKASADRVYDFLTTPTNLPSVWPSMVDVSNVKTRPDGWHAFDWIYKMVGFKLHGHAEAKKFEKNKLVEIRNEGGIPSTFRWIYEPRGGSTLLSVEVEYDIPTMIVGKFAESALLKINERELDTLLHNLRAVLESTMQAHPNGPAQVTR